MGLPLEWQSTELSPANFAIPVPLFNGHITLAGGTPLTEASPVWSVNGPGIRGAALTNLAIPVPLLF